MKVSITVVDEHTGAILVDLSANIRHQSPIELIESAAMFISALATISADVERDAMDEEDAKPVPATYTAKLASVGEETFIHAVKEIREFVKIPLKEAKDLANAAREGKCPVLKEGLNADEVVAIKKAFEAIGAKLEIV